jgi:hypothetical protein
MVKPFKRRPPLCHQCAVAAAGIRKGAKTAPVRSRREIKQFERDRRMAESRPEPPTPAEGGGFGPAKPAFAAGPARPAERKPQRGPVKQQQEQEQERQEEEEATTGPGRNRPLRGLAR